MLLVLISSSFRVFIIVAQAAQVRKMRLLKQTNMFTLCSSVRSAFHLERREHNDLLLIKRAITAEVPSFSLFAAVQYGLKKVKFSKHNKLTCLPLFLIVFCNICNSIYLKWGQRNAYENNLRSEEHYFSDSEMKIWKKFRPVRDWNPWLLRCWRSALPTIFAFL